MKRRRKNIEPQGQGLASQLLGLSLFIMLLAFFIVLNSISTFEELKARNVMESLEFTFASKIIQRGDMRPSVTKSIETSIYDGDTLDRVSGLFQAQIPSHEVVMNKERGMMHVRVPRDAFERAVTAIGQRVAPAGTNKDSAFQNDFLPTLVAMLRSEDRGQPFRMEITYNVTENPARMQRLAPQALQGTIRAVDAMAETIEKAGLPAKQITASVQQGDEAMVDLFFLRYEKIDASKIIMPGNSEQTPVDNGGDDGNAP